MVVAIQKINAQETITLIRDSISIEDVVKYVRTHSSYTIYAVIDSTFTINVNEKNVSPPELLTNVLAPTPYKVSVYENNIFLLKDVELITTHPQSLMYNVVSNKAASGSFIVQKIERATSENKVYVIGDPYAPSEEEQVVLKGKVTDFKTGDPLIGVNIVLKQPWTATVSDKDGNYTLKLPRGRVQLDISALNISDSRRHIMLYDSGTLNIEIEEEPHMLSEVVVTSGVVHNVRNTQMGVEKLQIARIKNIPMALGEVDILKVIQALPGVKTVGEASTGFNVRGGATDQNLILLNDGTIYNPNHLFGFFTAFSSDMIRDAEIYKSSIPAQYGGRISSVLDIRSREANKEKFKGSAGIGLVTSKLNLEIPVIKEKSSLLLTGRTTYSDWILKSLPKKSGYKDGTAGFYDVGGVYSHQFNPKNLLTVYGYYSHDRFSFNKDQKYGYTNINASARWRTIFNEKLYAYFTAGYDHYDYENTETTHLENGFQLSFDINQVFAKADFTRSLNESNKLDFGFKTTLYNINSGVFKPVGKHSLIKPDALQKDKALESAFYIGNEWEISPSFSVNAGIRYSIFNALGPRTYHKYRDGMLPDLSTVADTVSVSSGKNVKTYHGPELRLSARYAFSERFSVKAGFNSMKQYIHKLSNTMIMSPTDTWKLSDANILPQKGWQVATGAYLDSPNRLWEFSAEVYYKQMKDYLDYRSGARLLMNHHIETDVIRTDGHSYGVELAVRKPTGKFNGWMSYTYSRTFLRQNDKLLENPVNNGDWYPTEYDKPHDFKLVGNYKLTERYSVSFNVDYSTGRPTTVPAGKFYDHKLESTRVYYTDRNSYRIPDYFRTDISFNVEASHKLTLLTHSSFSFGVYNLTGRKNVYSIYYAVEEGKVKGYKMSIFGVPIPFITYNIRF